MATKNKKVSTTLIGEEASRLWQHAMHEETILNNRLNFFMVVESVLLGILGMLFGQTTNTPNREFILRTFMILGLALTMVWQYVAARQLYAFESVRKRARESLPEYATTRTEREKVRWRLSNLKLLCYVVPGIFFLVWIVLQFAV